MSLIHITHTTTDHTISSGYLTPELVESLRKNAFYRLNNARMLFFSYRRTGKFDYEFDINSFLVALTHSRKDIASRLKKVGDTIDFGFSYDKWNLTLVNDPELEATFAARKEELLNMAPIETPKESKFSEE